MSSQSTGDGNLQITVTFKLGTDLDIAQVLVQNRVAIAQPRLPDEVQRLGVTRAQELAGPADGRSICTRPTARATSSTSSNYATLQVKDVLARRRRRRRRHASSARATIRCASGSIPTRLAARSLTADDVVGGAARPERAGRRGRHRPAAGAAAAAPSSSTSRRWAGCRPRSSSATSSSRPTPDGRVTRVARRGAGRARRRGLHHQRLSRHQARRSPLRASSSGPAPTRSPPPTRLQATMEELSQALPAGPATTTSSTTRREFIARIDRRGDQDPVRGDRPGGDRGHPVPADLAGGDHPDRRHPGLADRHLRGAGGVRLLAQQPVAVRPGAGRSASSSTTPSSWSRTSSATCARA